MAHFKPMDSRDPLAAMNDAKEFNAFDDQSAAEHSRDDSVKNIGPRCEPPQPGPRCEPPEPGPKCMGPG